MMTQFEKLIWHISQFINLPISVTHGTANTGTAADYFLVLTLLNSPTRVFDSWIEL